MLTPLKIIAILGAARQEATVPLDRPHTHSGISEVSGENEKNGFVRMISRFFGGPADVQSQIQRSFQSESPSHRILLGIIL